MCGPLSCWPSSVHQAAYIATCLLNSDQLMPSFQPPWSHFGKAEEMKIMFPVSYEFKINAKVFVLFSFLVKSFGRPWQDSNLQSPVSETDALSIRPQGRCYQAPNLGFRQTPKISTFSPVFMSHRAALGVLKIFILGLNVLRRLIHLATGPLL